MGIIYIAELAIYQSGAYADACEFAAAGDLSAIDHIHLSKTHLMVLNPMIGYRSVFF